MDKLKQAKIGGKKTSVTQKVTMTQETPKKIPADAEILGIEERTETEQIENGFLICKTTETRYKAKGAEYTDWHHETKKWYSKTDPLEVKLTDKSLADAFD